MVGIKDIAKKAGVSISTVSYALNHNDDKISPKTKARILKIADEMNYVPNMAGRALKRKKTNIIGVYITSYSGYFYGSLLNGINETLRLNNYEMIVCSGKQTHIFIPERLIDGAIILDSNFKNKEINDYSQRGHALVVLDRQLTNPKISHILLDNQSGTEQATRDLINSAADHYYIFTGPKGNFDSEERRHYAQRIFSENNEPFTVLTGNFTKESGYQLCSKIDFKDKVGIFCLNDEMAIGVYDYISETNLEIGKDVYVIGFDHTEISRYITPKLSTVDYSMYKWGEKAAMSIIKILEDELIEHQVVDTVYIKGASTPN